MNYSTIKGLKVTIMGLGLHGGGIASARFFAEAGAIVTVTDLGDKKKLQPSVDKLNEYDINFILGEHREQDFTDADIVIKNPAVPSTSRFLKLAKRIETDISVFLQLTSNKIIAITGSKGKSTTVSAVYHVLKKVYPGTVLGGNITVSPLTFIHDLKKEDPVILELSSWQLADLGKRDLLKPEIAVITNIMNDHQNRYNCFNDYIDDKKLIYRNLKSDNISIFLNDNYGKIFESESNGTTYLFSAEKPDNKNLKRRGWLDNEKGFFCDDKKNVIEIIPESLIVPGKHFRLNMLISAMVLKLYGIEKDVIIDKLATFKGVPHRMELFAEKKGMKFYNDSAATIPEAVSAAISSFKTPVHLITGGTDKELDFSILKKVVSIPKGIYLLKGSGTDKLMEILKEGNVSWYGPYNSLNEALDKVIEEGGKNDSVILSPGCTSFGMFLNEFDRGDKFKELVLNL